MSLRVLHVLDHSLPLHSGYAFRTVSILREQRKLGWETFHVTTPKQGVSSGGAEEADGWTFHRTANTGQEGQVAQMRLTATLQGDPRPWENSALHDRPVYLADREVTVEAPTSATADAL